MEGVRYAKYDGVLQNHISFDATITRVVLGEDGAYSQLTVTRNEPGSEDKDGVTNGVIFTSKTNLRGADGKRITAKDLNAGQKIRVAVSGEVLMEPYDIYSKCCKIQALE